MRYLGGKHRQRKEIARLMTLEEGGTYWEPFVGGGSVAAAVAETGAFDNMRLSDLHLDLVLMWQAALDGWTPPEHVNEAEYAALKVAPPSAERGFVGFACSFAGKWFGGYARGGGRNWAAEGARGVVRKVTSLNTVSTVTVSHHSYDAAAPAPGDVLYLDPPYSDTTEYSTGGFDSDAFWTWARVHAENGVRVFISEFTAPDGWAPVWSIRRTATAHITVSKDAVEHLYCWAGVA
jgi:DNA adenine methylase